MAVALGAAGAHSGLGGFPFGFEALRSSDPRRFVVLIEARGNMDLQIEKMTREDWTSVQSIYREGIATGNATFETELGS